jgi:hypothetical protein
MKSADQWGDHAKTMRFPRGAGGDQAMTLERRDPKEAFDRLDANKDGSISRDEFTKGHEERMEKRIEIREQRKEALKDAKPGEKQAYRMHRMSGMGGSRMIVMADSDHDGKITLAEAEAMALQHFEQMDTNRGQVTPDERRAGRLMMIRRSLRKRRPA